MWRNFKVDTKMLIDNLTKSMRSTVNVETKKKLRLAAEQQNNPAVINPHSMLLHMTGQMTVHEQHKIPDRKFPMQLTLPNKWSC
jgi:hypothetical protein